MCVMLTPIPKDSWNICERILETIAFGTTTEALEVLERKFGSERVEELRKFLSDLGLVRTPTLDDLTDLGRQYYQAQYVLGDEEGAKVFLSKGVKQYPPTQAICQILWGRTGLNRGNVYRLLALEGYLDPDTLKEGDLGGFLMLLNRCDILEYNKKTGGIRIIYNPRVDLTSKPSSYSLSPETPYSNIRNMREILRECSGYIDWFDKHFSAKGLESLTDEADGTKIRRIRILMGVVSQGLNERLKRDFIRFREEMKVRGINAEIRVICDKGLLSSIHDRWILSQGLCYNVPPIDSIYMGQYSELKRTENCPPFDEWWNAGLDLLNDWAKIEETLGFRTTASKSH